MLSCERGPDDGRERLLSVPPRERVTGHPRAAAQPSAALVVLEQLADGGDEARPVGDQYAGPPVEDRLLGAAGIAVGHRRRAVHPRLADHEPPTLLEGG